MWLEFRRVLFRSEVYKIYPYIREDMILKDTSNLFIDTLQLSNLYLKGLGGDYDGDQLSVKIAYTEEANLELSKYLQSKSNYIGLSGVSIRESSNECIQAIYSLTRVVDKSKLVDMQF